MLRRGRHFARRQSIDDDPWGAAAVGGAGGFAGHVALGHWDWRTSLVLGIAVFIGGQIGARKSIRIDKKKMKKGFGWLLMAIALLMVVKAIL